MRFSRQPGNTASKLPSLTATAITQHYFKLTSFLPTTASDVYSNYVGTGLAIAAAVEKISGYWDAMC